MTEKYTEKERFESWFINQGMNKNDLELFYGAHSTALMWMAWNARLEVNNQSAIDNAEGDPWVKRSDATPTIDDADENGLVWFCGSHLLFTQLLRFDFPFTVQDRQDIFWAPKQKMPTRKQP